MTQTKHCRTITKTPVVAQTNLQIKLDFLIDLQDLGLSVARGKPWGIFFPPGFDPGDAPANGGDVGNGFV